MMEGFHVVTNVIRLNCKIFTRGRVNFYYIADTTNQVAVPSGKSPIWAASFNSYLRQSSSQQEIPHTPINPRPTTIQDQQQIPVTTVTIPKIRKRKSIEVATKYNASVVPLEKLTTFEKRVLEVKLAWKSSYGTVFPSDIL